jgi:hypothetical protein
MFDYIGEFEIGPNYNPCTQKKSFGLWYHASFTLGKVIVEQPSYCTKEGNILKLPVEAQLRNMIYSSHVHVEMKKKCMQFILRIEWVLEKLIFITIFGI